MTEAVKKTETYVQESVGRRALLQPGQSQSRQPPDFGDSEGLTGIGKFLQKWNFSSGIVSLVLLIHIPQN